MPAIESSDGDIKPPEMTSPRKDVEAYLTTLHNASRLRFHDGVAELFFLQNGGNMMDFPLWRKKPPRVFQEFLDSFALESRANEDMVAAVVEAPVETQSPVAKLHLSASLPVPSRTSAGQPGRPPQNAVMTPEQIVEKAKQEAFVMQRIAELQREGLWSEKRMPKVAEPVRHKSHWDYLLEEMAWLSADFVQERKWKKAAARKCARMVQKYFQDKAAAAVRAEKEEEQRMRKVASFIAKEIRTFWSNVQKFLEYKQQTRLEEKRKKALDQHLNFIVTETEKYSNWLSEGLAPSGALKGKEEEPEPGILERRESDGEFRPEGDSTDDEETIAKEEEEDGQSQRNDMEIDDLKRESEMPLEDLLNELPPGYLESIGQPVPRTPSEPSDEEFEIGSNVSAEDDEETIDQAEREAESDSGSELMELEAEKDMPLEQLMERYGQRREQAVQQMEQVDEDSEGLTGESDYEVESETEKDAARSAVEGNDLGIESLLENVAGEDGAATSSKLSDAAALAESFQPKGNTLESTKVIAQVPFLLKHTLREYQHIGLDWMAAMYERKLNGILADEMGLGKTIQTIALLAWLACEKGIWGPHLVVVPTSVMLNWEMEFKKWCPAFKILTYYGSQKDRKQKRIGWTKPNAFHVCITSYKLVLQDHQAFRRKRWRYLILDEAQNIKNFKSQRWQLLLNFQTQRRLLLTGTPLQNNLMELWSLMHFLMPDIFESHRDFREWFSNPVTGMIEGNAEYNESVIRKLHKVLRPFILRRLKSEVEKQLPRKYEHVVMCRLSKRQRYLYDDFMSRAKTKETLESGNLLSVINVLMQLRKVCNHPNLFEQRPIVSPFQMHGIVYQTASLVYGALDYDPFKHVNLSVHNLLLADLEVTMTAFAAHRIKRFQAPTPLIQEIDSLPPPPPRCPRGKIRLHVRPSNSQLQVVPAGLGRGMTPRPVGAAPKPGILMTPSTAGGVAAPLQPRLAAPAPTLISAASAAASTGAATVARSVAVLPLANATVQPVSTVASQVMNSVGATNNSIAGKLAQRISAPSTPTTASRLVSSRQHATASVTPQGNASNSRPATARDSLTSTGVNSNSHGSTTGLAVARIRTAGEAIAQNGPDAVNCSRRGSKFTHDRSVFKASCVDEKRRQERRQRLEFLAKLNKKHCEACPIYGADLVESAMVMGTSVSVAEVSSLPRELCWSRPGTCYANCLRAVKPIEGRRVWQSLWAETDALRSMIRTPEFYIKELNDVLRKFVVAIPPVSAPRISLHVAHPPPSKLWDEQVRCHRLRKELAPRAALLHPIVSGMMTQFPDARLIQYDCGKLQTLDPLLRQLKAGKHRALIFTQMTRMLDVLEAFLNYHGYIYLRLDGTTKVDQRQALMERFNADPRIFCFILSTRSGGIGINLTGADTVIFYDSDWNPTMDAQAQDRCHRIGQTRDVHIYRLISERTVEENILKKANQKRLLGDIAIEGGNFSAAAAAFKKSTIHDIFYVDAKESDASKRMAEVIDGSEDSEKASPSAAAVVGAASQEVAAPGATKAALGVFETALAAVEDETDVAAARTVRAEAAADMAEFDESAPIAAEGEGEPEVSKAEAELQQLEHQLKPVERYAMRFMEEGASSWAAEQLRAAEAQIEEQKRAWEQRRLAALAEKESKELSEDELLNDTADNPALSYSSKDASDQMWISMDGGETMPIWAPPTPPTDDNDVYIDFSLAYLYEPEIMDSSRLPPVHVHKELKRTRKESTHVLPPDDGRRPPKIRKEETVYAPRSLFDRPSPALAKFRRDWKLQKVRGIVRPPPLANLLPKVPAQPLRPVEEPENVPEWLVHEDWTLLQAVQNLLELPLNLVVLTPAHTPNWDLVSDLVNSGSRTYRSPKQCRNRYISVILPREEGKVTVDTSPKKIKKAKSLVKVQQLPGSSKTSTRPMRTSQLFVADNNLSFTSAWHQKFEVLKSISNKRTPTNRSLLGYGNSSSSSRGAVNPKHASVLNDAGISYETPLNPVEVAALRAERIAQKQKSAAALTESQQQPQPVQPQQRLVAQAAKPPASPATSVTLPPASPIAARLTPIPVGSPATSVLTANLQSSSPAPAASAVVLGAGSGQPTLVLQNAAVSGQQQGQQLLLQAPLRAQRPLAVGTAASSAASGTAVVSVAGLTAAQAQMLASAGLTLAGSSATTTPASSAAKPAAVTVVQTTTTITTPTTAKTLTPAQLQYLRQQQLVKQQQQQRLALQDQQTKKLQLTAGATTAAPKIITTGAAGTTTAVATTLTTVQIPAGLTQQQQSPRAQLLKSGGSTTLIRSSNPTEVAALLKRQQLQKAAAGMTTSVQQPVATVHISNTAQLLAQAGLQVQTAPAAGGQTQVAALVKTVSSPANLGGAPSVTIPVSAIGMGLSQVKGLATAGVKQGTPTQQQLRQIALQQQLLQQRKAQQGQQQLGTANKTGQIAQSITLGAVKGSIVNIPAQQLVSTAGGSVQIVQPLAVTSTSTGGAATSISSTVTMQQLQQVVRQVTAGNAQMLVSTASVSGSSGAPTVVSTSLIAKAGQSQTVQARMIPVQQQALKQVLAAGQARLGATAVAPSLASAIASGKLRVQGGTPAEQQALLSKVSAALQSGQPVSLALKNPGVPAARIQSSTIVTTTTAVVTTVAATLTTANTVTTASEEAASLTMPAPSNDAE